MSTSTLRIASSIALTAGILVVESSARADDATFYRGINLNGPALAIDGRAWEASRDAKDFSARGNTFENQSVALRPATDSMRAQMIRSSIWGNVDLELGGVASGVYQVLLWVWEDNDNERFDLLVDGRVVVAAYQSGTTGAWKRLGPWRVQSAGGMLVISARGGAANLSGLEIWAGDGEIPDTTLARFAGPPAPEQLAFFESKIRPALAENCYECHSAEAKRIRGGLLLDSRAGVRKGGDSGPVVVPGEPDASRLIQALRRTNADFAMPPKQALPAHVIADFEMWVRMAVPDPREFDTVAAVEARESIDWSKAREWWSFRPLATAEPPAVQRSDWPRDDIDRFILARLEEVGLEPAADADKRTLIRRATYDLIGLPPAPEEVAAFLADESPDAFARVVDRLLESPRYGERQARLWFDVVRYADTAGDNSDYPIPQIHRYRDWVIAAFQRDLPYDEFVRDQLAGDLRGGASDAERFERIVATGYIANSRRFGSRVDDYPQHLTIEDTIDNVGRSFLGLSLSCARCHDHKFDPITTKDYYALYGIFHSTRYPWPGIELDKRQRDFVPLVEAHRVAEVEVAKREREAERVRLDKEVQRLKEALKDARGEKKDGIQAQLKNAEKAAAEHTKKPALIELAYAVADKAAPEDVAVQLEGNPSKPGEIVRRRFLTLFGGEELPQDSRSSGRAELAEWILAADHPLPARVMANRIWQQHFGRGIVPTPNDFGRQGKPPAHPELLDHLAASFRDGGWSLKSLHRSILLSHTYRMSPARSADAATRDPSNELLAGFPRRRLDAESIRDALLALGGNLDSTPAGAHAFPPEREWNFTQHEPFKAVYASDRRSVYLMTQRIQRHPYLAIFDGADPSASTPARMTSTTPLQALYLLNSSFVHEQAELIADRVTKHADEETERLHRAYDLLFARPPQADEIAAAREFLATAGTILRDDGVAADRIELEAWRAYVRVLVRLNEFVYID